MALSVCTYVYTQLLPLQLKDLDEKNSEVNIDSVGMNFVLNCQTSALLFKFFLVSCSAVLKSLRYMLAIDMKSWDFSIFFFIRHSLHLLTDVQRQTWYHVNPDLPHKQLLQTLFNWIAFFFLLWSQIWVLIGSHPS